MPLIPMPDMLAEAKRQRFAVCYCESWSLESLQAVVEAAEELRSPIIAGFNGGFLMHESRTKPEDLTYYAGFSLALNRAPVPVGFILNESKSLDQIKQAMELGFNAVMVENEGLEFAEYRDLVKIVAEIAHLRSVAVEAQVGHLADGSGRSDAELTDPEVARAFVETTRVDALAVSIGNVHVLTRGKASIDLGILRRVSSVLSIPLVVHGGTGFPLEFAQAAIELGVTKFNFGTILKQAFLKAVRDKPAEYREPMNPHPFLGMGGHEDILIAGREAVKAKTKELIQACGSAGKAW